LAAFHMRLLIFLITAFLLMSPEAWAQSSNQIICPINCDQPRELYFSNPPLKGEDVRGLQDSLHILGFHNTSRNGVFDSQTEKAVCLFQKQYGLQVDGRVVDDTWDVMARAIERPGTAKTKSPPPGEKVIVIDTVRRTLTLFNDGEPYHQFPVAVGKYETPSPIGNWKILRKATNWGTGFGTRWMGLSVNWGIYGIHGTNRPYSIGGYQSHGCIRMFNGNVEQLYRWVPVGTPVVIVGNPFLYMEQPYGNLKRGDRGSAVMEVQDALKRLGYNLEVDGIWGFGMEKSIIKYRKDTGLPFDNKVDAAMYKSLGLK